LSQEIVHGIFLLVLDRLAEDQASHKPLQRAMTDSKPVQGGLLLNLWDKFVSLLPTRDVKIKESGALMRIVHVIRQFPPCIGGLENVVRDVAFAQAQHGHQVRVITLNRHFASGAVLEPAHEILNGVEVVRISYKGSRRYPLAPDVLHHIKDADLVHVHAIDFFFDFLALTALWHRKPMVVSPHGAFFHTSFARRLKTLYFHTVTRVLLRFYRSVICLSQHDYELFLKIRHSGMIWWDYGIDTQKFRDGGALTPQKSIFTLSRFSINKRIDRLMDFVAALRRRDPDWTLTIAGTEWDYNEASLRDMAWRKGIDEATTILVRASDAALREQMRRSSLFASASEYEAFGIAPVEGLSAGMIPLLSDIHSYKSVVEGAKIGLNVDFDQPEAAVEAFLPYWASVKERYSEIREAAMQAAAPYDWSAVAKKFEPVYQAALGLNERRIGPISVRALTQNEAQSLLESQLETRTPLAIAYANAHSVNIAAKDEAFRHSLSRALVLNDGIGLDLASLLLFRKRFPANLNGTDFTPAFLQACRKPLRIFLLGAKPGIAEKAAKVLHAIAPQHKIVGIRHGYFTPQENDGIIRSIREAKADVILVALGNPIQELWLDRNLAETGCLLGFSVGALFDFLAGEIPRAPEWIRKARLEWVYRLIQEPTRLARRYLIGNGVFLARAIRQWLGGARA
jgi:alpha-1,3-mannosyltransferase